LGSIFAAIMMSLLGKPHLKVKLPLHYSTVDSNCQVATSVFFFDDGLRFPRMPASKGKIPGMISPQGKREALPTTGSEPAGSDVSGKAKPRQ
jgi:hypothetical protein